jgi:DNA topoisomerase-2
MLLQGTTANRMQRHIGLLPLKGKVLNCSSASNAKVSNNAEIQDLKKSLGLNHKKQYSSTASLRYGRVLVATDADDDGMHILGLLLTMFQKLYPGLIELGYVQRLVTPLLTARKGKTIHEFFTMDEYKKWQASTSDFQKFTIKFYKGLGTSTNKDAKRYFSNLPRYIRPIKGIVDGTDALSMFFQKSRIEERKEYVRAPVHRQSGPQTLRDFVYGELHGYARSSIVRAIPGHDGMKQSARKILYTCLKKNLYGPSNDIKVSELAGIVSKDTHYHHGSASLEAAIIILARRFKTVNPLPLLRNEGQFGSYLSGGRDHASSRYVFTRLEDVCKLLFNSEDLHVLPKTIVDGKEAEPTLLAPLLPIHLLNGSKGIATGFATQIYSYSALDLIDAALLVLAGKACPALCPNFRDWDGQLDSCGSYFTTEASVSVHNGKTIVRDLAIGVFPDDFCKALKERKHSVQHTRSGPVYTLHGIEPPPKRKQKHSLGNMHALDANGVITKYECAASMLQSYMVFKLHVTGKRIRWKIANLEKKIALCTATQLFIARVLDGSLRFLGATDADLRSQLLALGVEAFSEFLLQLPIRRLTQSQMTRAEKNAREMRQELASLRSTTAKRRYTEELLLLKAHLSQARKRKREASI